MTLKNTFPSGLFATRTNKANGTAATSVPDGTGTTEVVAPDPRFELLAPLKTTTRVTPGGLSETIAEDRSVALSNPSDPFSVTSITEHTTINGKVYTRVFDALSRTWTFTTPMGRTSTTTLDALGRTTQTQTSGLFPLSLAYDANGRLTTTTQFDRTSTFGYDPMAGWLTNSTNPLNQTTTFARDAVGRIIATTRPDAAVIGQSYDKDGNVATVTPPARPAHDFSYTPVNLLADYLPPFLGFNPRDTQYSYDGDRRVTSVLRPDLLQTTYDYDFAGRLGLITAPTETRSYTYSPATGRLLSIASPGVTLSYTWDGNLMTSMAWSGAVHGSVGLAYDNDFRVSMETVNAGGPVSIQYDLDSLVSQAGDLAVARGSQNALITGTSLGVVSDSYAYSGFGEVSSYAADMAVVPPFPIYKLDFIRDTLGRIIQKTEIIGGATTVYGYSYDLAGRLIQVTTNGNVTATYSYDPNGNRLSKDGIAGTYDDQDRLLTYGPFSYTYTANGELASKLDIATNQTTHYLYDVFGNLAQVTMPNGDVIAYLADPQNRRIQKKVNGVIERAWLYKDDLRPIAELDANNNVISRFVYALGKNVPEYMIKGGNTYRIITDQVGSVRLLVDTANGGIAQRIDYDEFGIVTADSNPGFQPFGFAGGIYDPDTGLVRFGARDYDAVTGRWTAKDPIRFGGGDSNIYSYVAADPVNHTDAAGHDAKDPALCAACHAAAFVSAAACAKLCTELPAGAALCIAGCVLGGAALSGFVCQASPECQPEFAPAPAPAGPYAPPNPPAPPVPSAPPSCGP